MDTLNDKSLIKDKCLIAGKWVGGSETADVINPATGAVITTVPRLGAKETEEAIAGAAEAMKGWAKKTAKERSIVLRRWYDLMMENQDDLARIMTAEQGKPLAEAKGEVVYGASFTEF
ncbi:MAG: aldehyde dehydrogenase family protein, partial [Pseudomonadota bacterium]